MLVTAVLNIVLSIVLGNIIGSNICNLLLIFGIVAIIKPIKFEKSTLKQKYNVECPIAYVIYLLNKEST